MEERFTILRNEKIAKDVYEMRLLGNTESIKAPGQFINIKLEGFFLRRPISVCSWDGSTLTIVYKIVGEGTRFMSEMEDGKELYALTGLGNGFDTEKCGSSPVLAGGGAGVPPMFGLAETLLERGITPQVVLGFNTEQDVFYAGEFRRLGIEPVIMTLDGSSGRKGLVTDGLKDMECDYVFACGPEAMLKAVSELFPAGQFSFEARMGCGFGACMGCSCETKYGFKRICKEGPVLFKEEIKW